MRWARLGPALALGTAALLAAVLTLTGSDDPGDDAATDEAPAPTEITSDAPRFASLTGLAAASDLIVRGRVVSTERGRTFGEPGGAAVESRLVRLFVVGALSGPMEGHSPVGDGAGITIEEPGWLDDGTPLIVDGVPPTETGDEVIWFLDAVPSPALDRPGDAPAYVLVGPQGNYRIDGDRLEPAAGDDPVADELAALGPDGLVAAVRALFPLTVP